MHDLFEAVRQEILALAPEVREEFTRHYVAYKTQTNFTDVVPQKRRLLLMLNMRFDEISDPRGLAADVTNLGLWGNGDVQVEVDNARQIAYAMELVRQAFAARQPGGARGMEASPEISNHCCIGAPNLGQCFLQQRLIPGPEELPMPAHCNPDLFDFAPVEDRSVVAAFDGGTMTSDAGALLLGATDRAVGLIDRLAACFVDQRDQEADRT